MSGKMLLDSNIIIYLSKGELHVDKLFDDKKKYFISVITYMETLGFQFETFNEKEFIQQILSFFKVIYIDKKIADKVIEIRQHKKIKLPDAIIAATALVRKCDLITRNINDFNNIDDSLNVLNPFDINWGC
ncbi:MAG: type II toxin-antitoxin system VapC family toxin [Desulfamplus sp.]|nr:type II toxin-antitoxin system VapC family toxin [Desulfamplus sp.]MBF0390661.1 type II toxin-antitoxin system VapC family toxin [Desulfamplus sp.]